MSAMSDSELFDVGITKFEAAALRDFLSLAMDCFGPGAADVLYEFGGDRYDAVWEFANRAEKATL